MDDRVSKYVVDLWGRRGGLISFYNNGDDGYHVVIAHSQEQDGPTTIFLAAGQLKLLAESLPAEKTGRHELKESEESL